jgi:hypothetical protein
MWITPSGIPRYNLHEETLITALQHALAAVVHHKAAVHHKVHTASKVSNESTYVVNFGTVNLNSYIQSSLVDK